ncbi:MAG: TetR family transcriptional regulator [Kineosporiaceae bacterium]
MSAAPVEPPGPREALLAKAIAWFAAHGVGDTSLRTLATALGTSHRMLIYHFGSREGLLGAVVEAVERGERAVMADFLATHDDPFEAGAAFWTHVADRAQIFAPLFFELSGTAMQGKPYAASLRQWLATGWVEELADGFRRSGFGDEQAVRLARLSLGTARGLLFELAATGDRAATDDAMAEFTAMVRTASR